MKNKLIVSKLKKIDFNRLIKITKQNEISSKGAYLHHGANIIQSRIQSIYLSPLKEVLLSCFKKEIKDFEISSAWSNKSNKNSHHRWHDHSSSKVSVLIYLNQPKNNQKNMFGATIFKIDRMLKYIKIKPKSGLIVLFDSEVKHMVCRSLIRGRRTLSVDLVNIN